jgi:hypothetical protein
LIFTQKVGYTVGKMDRQPRMKLGLISAMEPIR